ncbi:hypothetical protein [Halovivax cerinus]|uniref:CopG family transcriptional regulator n=1 Tax=Halovivax cerinus TaxID=1487865 RepID=A0ABD5NLE0_9EURY|nr:hypothetical protein [Halovivax cerinus]
MVKNVNVALDDRDYQKAIDAKDELGLTWEEFIVEAAECLEEHGTREA